MDLTNIATIKFLLRKYGIRPNKRLGQNFLIDKEVLDKMVRTIFTEDYNLDSGFRRNDNKINRNDNKIFEIGPGLGTLTQELCQRAKRVIAIEKDPVMCEILRETCSGYKNLTIINKDILRTDIVKMQNAKCKNQNDKSKCKIVGNIPYSITSPLIRKLLVNSEIYDLPAEEAGSLFAIQDIVFMVQKEVAERICAKEGESERGFLSVLVQYYAKPEIMRIVPREAFWPRPEVESAILRIVPCYPSSNGIEARIVKRLSSSSDEIPKRYRNKPRNRLTKLDDDFFRLVKIGFSARRKTLVNNLSAGLRIPKQKTAEIVTHAGLDPRARAQDLSIEDWEKLLKETLFANS